MRRKLAWILGAAAGSIALAGCGGASGNGDLGGQGVDTAGGETNGGETQGVTGAATTGSTASSGSVSAGTAGSTTGGAGTTGGAMDGATTSSGGSPTGGGSDGGARNPDGGGPVSSTGMTGSVGTGGSTSTGGSSGGGACRPKFASGVNVAWVRFGNDIPNPNITAFDTIFQNTHDAGGRVIRWWLHANGTVTPGYDSSGMANPISAADIADIKTILDAAHAAGVAVNISLWSFDMLQSSASKILTQNNALLTQDANRQAYIDRWLTPLVTALKGYPGLYSWEIFNEPEGMTTQHGWVPAANRIDEKYVQITVNWFADAIHNADPSALVTNGAWTFTALSGAAPGGQNYYSDSALLGAGSRAKGTLDFYEVHYYASNGAMVSPFTHQAASWNLDKRLVVGEFWALDTDGVTAPNLYTKLYDNGYNGAWAWQYYNNDNNTMSTKWPAMQVPMQNLYAAQAADVDCP